MERNKVVKGNYIEIIVDISHDGIDYEVVASGKTIILYSPSGAIETLPSDNIARNTLRAIYAFGEIGLWKVQGDCFIAGQHYRTPIMTIYVEDTISS